MTDSKQAVLNLYKKYGDELEDPLDEIFAFVFCDNDQVVDHRLYQIAMYEMTLSVYTRDGDVCRRSNNLRNSFAKLRDSLKNTRLLEFQTQTIIRQHDTDHATRSYTLR